MNIDTIIEKWQEKHSEILSEYSKGHISNEVMQMYRSQMKNVLDFIKDLEQVKNIAYEPVLAPVNYKQHYIDWRDKYFSKVNKVFEYKTKNKTEYFTTEQLHKKYEKAMLESPFNGC